MNYINILALDTALTGCSVALSYNDKITEKVSFSDQDRSLNLLNMLHQLLNDIEIDELSALAFSAGPGSLTGLKIGSSVIQALNLVYNKPIIKVSTLQILALQAYEQFGEKLIMPCIDAKMGEVYYGVYRIVENGNTIIPIAIQEDAVIPVKSLKISDPNLLLVSEKSEFLNSIFSEDLKNSLNIQSVSTNYSARYIIKIANYIYINYDKRTNDALPLYLRSYE